MSIPCNPCTTYNNLPEPVKFDVEKFINNAMECLGVSRLFERKRCSQRELVDAKRIIAYTLKQRAFDQYSLRGISELLKGKDHTYAKYWIDTCKELLETDQTFFEKYNRVIALC